jgi:hypothetical protein
MAAHMLALKEAMPMYFLTFIKIFHLIGLIMGFGGAVLLDFTIFSRGILRPVSQFTIHQTVVISRVVFVGLAVLWITGAMLIWMNWQVKPEYITNQKLWAKIAIVILLSVNGVLIHHRILPLLKAQTGRRLFDHLNKSQLAFMTLVGSVSLVSWITPFILGKASELNYVTPMVVIMAIYLAAVCVAWFGLFVTMSSITALQKFARRAAEATLRSNDSWENNIHTYVPAARPRAPNAPPQKTAQRQQQASAA